MNCGESDDRNKEYNLNYSPEKFFKKMITRSCPVILDIGAHIGESVMFFNSVFSDATIFSVEPDPTSFSKLEKFIPDSSKAINAAIGSVNGQATFYQYDKSHLNSLYAINEDSKDSLGYAEKSIASKVKVRCMTLDSLIQEIGIDDQRIDLLKIDAQGGEYDILLGGQTALKNVDNITLELSLFDFYKKKNTFLDIEKLLSGFELYTISKLSQNPKNFRTDWVEVFYTRVDNIS